MMKPSWLFRMKTPESNIDNELKLQEKSSFGSNTVTYKIIRFIENFKKSVVQDFFVGTTNNPEIIVFNHHHVNRNSSSYIFIVRPRMKNRL